MQALVVVLDDDLPVGPDLVDGDLRDPQVCQSDPGQLQRLVLLVGEVLEQGTRLLAREVDEDEPLPDVDVDRPERGRCAVDLVLLDHRGRHERAVQGVAPRVVGTAQVGPHLALLVVADPGPPVSADVVERPDLLVLAAHDQDALVGDLHPHPGAGPGHPLGTPDVDPVAVEHLRLVEGVGLLGVVGGTGEGHAHVRGHSLTVRSVSQRCHLRRHVGVASMSAAAPSLRA